MTSGYLHPAYAVSLSEFGTPRHLSQCGGWILQRQIPGFLYHDAMGCYPLFACQDWSQLAPDLERLDEELVSLALVTDPFGDYDLADLHACFKDVVIAFKQHYVVDLSRPMDTFVHPHHRRNVRKALRQVLVEHCPHPTDHVDEWAALYENLVARHHISGIPAFSRQSLAKQLGVPGVSVLRALEGDTPVGMLIWYTQGDVAYYHLGAFSERGYELGASFALFSHAIEHMAQCGLRWLDLGAGAGTATGQTSGLDRFKAGWSNGFRTAFFCGRILNRSKYQEIVTTQKVARTPYFPAYRLGEFH